MKTSLFLVLAGASFALCNCQQQTPAATTEAPVASAPIKVVAEKNEITPVTIGGGLAPSSVKGKSIVLTGKSDDTSYYIDFKNGGIDIVSHEKFTYKKTGNKTAKLIGSGGSTYTLTFESNTKGIVSGAMGVNVFEIN